MLNPKSIGQKIGAARKKVNLSQAKLAQQVSISAQAVGKWERGESMPDIATLSRLAEILGVDLNYFSESYPSVEAETTAVEPLIRPSVELLPSVRSKKPAWNMSEGNWANADFSGIKNLQERFNSSNMRNCKFVGSDMSGLGLKSNNVESCNFSNSDLQRSKFQSSNLSNNLFKDCSLQEAEFLRCNIEKCDFSGSHINGSKFQTSYFANNQFKEASLKNAEFIRSSMEKCDLTGADFTDAQFKASNFENNIMAGAIWNSTVFKDSGIGNVVFEGALADCSFENCSFSKVTFQNAKLTNTFFKCRNLKRIKFIDCQADRMTYEFLKNGKADLSGITLIW